LSGELEAGEERVRRQERKGREARVLRRWESFISKLLKHFQK